MKSKPASSAARPTVARSVPSRAGPPGQEKSGICSPIFTGYLHGRGSHIPPGGLMPASGCCRQPGGAAAGNPRPVAGPGSEPSGGAQNGKMSRPVLKALTLVTTDGVPIDAAHLPGDSDLAIVLAHGFTLSWQRPAVWQVATRLNRVGGVVTFDFRGHGRSGGLSTMGDRETRDLEVAVAYARELGYRRVATVGFSMGASIVVRHAALVGGVDAVVSVSGPGRWYFRGTKSMRRVHWAVERRLGRVVTRTLLNTRVSPVRWDPVPLPPA